MRNSRARWRPAFHFKQGPYRLLRACNPPALFCHISFPPPGVAEEEGTQRHVPSCGYRARNSPPQTHTHTRTHTRVLKIARGRDCEKLGHTDEVREAPGTLRGPHALLTGSLCTPSASRARRFKSPVVLVLVSERASRGPSASPVSFLVCGRRPLIGSSWILGGVRVWRRSRWRQGVRGVGRCSCGCLRVLPLHRTPCVGRSGHDSGFVEVLLQGKETFRWRPSTRSLGLRFFPRCPVSPDGAR